MSKWTISDPGAAGGFDKEAHLGHLTFFVEPRAEVTKAYSGDEDQTAARCDFVGCIDCPLVLADPPLVYGNALVPMLLDRGEIVAGRLVLGKQRPGKNSPYVLEPPTDADREAIEKFLDENAMRMPSGKVVIEQLTTRESEV